MLDVEPEHVAIRTLDGETVEERATPRGTFPLPFDDFTTPWDAIQVAYFASAATWNYLTAPFVFASPGVRAREIEPWQEDGETWRRLAVTFPEHGSPTTTPSRSSTTTSGSCSGAWTTRPT